MQKSAITHHQIDQLEQIYSSNISSGLITTWIITYITGEQLITFLLVTSALIWFLNCVSTKYVSYIQIREHLDSGSPRTTVSCTLSKYNRQALSSKATESRCSTQGMTKHKSRNMLRLCLGTVNITRDTFIVITFDHRYINGWHHLKYELQTAFLIWMFWTNHAHDTKTDNYTYYWVIPGSTKTTVPVWLGMAGISSCFSSLETCLMLI